MNKEKIERIGEIADVVAKLAPLVIDGVGAAVEQFTKLLSELKATSIEDLHTAMDAANAEGHAEVKRLADRAAEAREFLATHNPGIVGSDSDIQSAG